MNGRTDFFSFFEIGIDLTSPVDDSPVTAGTVNRGVKNNLSSAAACLPAADAADAFFLVFGKAKNYLFGVFPAFLKQNWTKELKEQAGDVAQAMERSALKYFLSGWKIIFKSTVAFHDYFVDQIT